MIRFRIVLPLLLLTATACAGSSPLAPETESAPTDGPILPTPDELGGPKIKKGGFDEVARVLLVGASAPAPSRTR